MIFSFLATFQVIHCAFLPFHLFQCSLPHCRSYSVPVPFSTFFQFPRHNPGLTVCIFCFPWFSVFSPYSSSSLGHFSFSRFSMSLAIFHVQHCVSHFLWFSVLSPYSRSYSVHSTFSTFISLPRHIPGPTVFVSHFPCFFIFLFIIQVLQRLFLIFHFFECFSPYFTSYSVCFLFCMFFIVSHQVLCPTMPVSLFPCL